MAQDWFSTNAPKADNGDWFATNAPAADFRAENAKDAQGKPVISDAQKASALQMLGIQPGAIGLNDPMWGTIVGAMKGAGGSLYNAGRAVSMLPGLPTLPPKPAMLEPRNTAERVGQLAEQTAEFFVPAGLVKAGAAKIATAAPRMATAARAGLEALSAGGVAYLQGSDPVVPAVLGAAGPLVSRGMEQLPTALRDAAEKKVVQALGPTKERFKAMALRLTPEMLKRGLSGSRESLLAKATEAAEIAGDQIDEAIQQYGSRRVGVAPVVTALETAKDAFRTPNAAGATVTFEPRAVRQLDGLQRIVGDLGDTATVEQLIQIRRAWDKVVDQAGGFAHRAGGAIGVPLKDQSEAWAKREATSAIRGLLAAEVPELAAINKEYAFQKSLKDVLTQTLQRTQPQGPSLGRAVAQMAGAAAGSSHGIGAAALTGKVAEMAKSVFTSPRWRLLDARTRDALARAIEGGNQQQIAFQVSRAAAAIGARMPSPAQTGQ